MGRKISEKTVITGILFLPVSFLLFFFIIPLFMIFFLAIGLNIGSTFEFTVNHFISVLSHPLNQYFLYWDLQQAFLTTVGCLIIGIPGGYILAHYKFPLKSWLRSLLTIPFILPPIVVLIGFITVFGHGSWINQMWEDMTGYLLIDIYNSYEGIILAHLFYNIPVMIRLSEIGWKNIDTELIAVARSLRASKRQIFLRVQLPHLFPILAAASLLIFIYAFNSFAIVLVLGGVQFQTLEVRIYSLARSSFDFNGAAALTIVQLIINVLVILLYLYYSNKYELPTVKSTEFIEKSLTITFTEISTYIKPTLILLYFIFVGSICILPIYGVFYASFMTGSDVLTLSNFLNLFDLNLRSFIGLSPQTMIINTLFFGISVTILASVLALLLNHGLHYETVRKPNNSRLTLIKSISGTIVILPLAVSSITLAFALFNLYRFTPFYENVYLAIILAQTLIAFPFAYRIITATRSNLDPTVINVARSLGSSRLRTFVMIEIPLLLSGIIVAGLFSFAVSVGEFGATTFLARANFATIPVGIYRLINTRNIGPAAAFSAILIIITGVSFLIIERMGKLDLRI